MTDRLYTVKDIARLITRDASPEAVSRAMRQVRHWTNNDLLSPLGGKDTGTGVSRVYAKSEVYKAALIHELARYGVTVDMLSTIGDWVDGLMMRRDWRAAVAGEEDCYLEFTWASDGASYWKVLIDPKQAAIRQEFTDRAELDAASAIVVNIRTLFRRLRF